MNRQTRRATNRSFAVALALVVMVVVIVATLWWLVQAESESESGRGALPKTPVVAPAPALWPPHQGLAALSGAKLSDAAPATEETRRRVSAAVEATEALVRIRGGAAMPTFEEDLRHFDRVSAEVEAELDLPLSQRAGLRARLESAYATLVEHDTRMELGGAKRLAAMDAAFRRLQTLIEAGDLRAEEPSAPLRAVSPGKRTPFGPLRR